MLSDHGKNRNFILWGLTFFRLSLINCDCWCLLQLNVGMKSDMFPFPRRRVGEDNLNSLRYAAVFTSPFTFFLVAKVECPFWIHPGRLTWNQKVTQVERKLIFQTSMIRFHVNLQGCSCSGLILHFDLPQESSHKEWHLQACFVLRVVATGEKERAAENRWLYGQIFFPHFKHVPNISFDLEMPKKKTSNIRIHQL